MKTRFLVFAAIVSVFLLLVIFAAAFLAWDWHHPYGKRGRVVTIEIPKGSNAAQTCELLEDKDLVRSKLSFKLAFAILGKERGLKAGRYRFSLPVSPLEILNALLEGHVFLVKVTIPEGLTMRGVAARLAKAGLGSEKSLLEAMQDPRPIKDLDPLAGNLEGYLFPETYTLAQGLSPRKVVGTLVDGFRKWWKKRADIIQTTMTPRQVATMASLVEKETAVPAERGLIAGVFFNRLRLGMPLQTDPSIIYAEELNGAYKGRLLRKDLSYPSPYNTYLHTGLPPGPICNPGRASLDAVIHPTPSAYLYFVNRGNNTHAFSKTLREHDRWVRRYREHERE